MAVLCFTISCGTSAAHAFTSADADAIFDAHTKAFYRVTVVIMQVTRPTETAKSEESR